MSANTAAIRDATAIPTTIRIPDTTSLAKKSWPMPRMIAFVQPSTDDRVRPAFDVVGARGRLDRAQRRLDVVAERLHLRQPDERPDRAFASWSPATRKISVAKLKGRVKGGTFQACITAAGVTIRIDENAETTMIQTIASSSHSGARNRPSPPPTRMPLNP